MWQPGVGVHESLQVAQGEQEDGFGGCFNTHFERQGCEESIRCSGKAGPWNELHVQK